jgi:hypothetical protein
MKTYAKPKWTAEALRRYIKRKLALARMHDRAILREMREQDRMATSANNVPA